MSILNISNGFERVSTLLFHSSIHLLFNSLLNLSNIIASEYVLSQSLRRVRGTMNKTTPVSHVTKLKMIRLIKRLLKLKMTRNNEIIKYLSYFSNVKYT